MYYFRYFLKCCIRNIARLICKPKILFVLCLSFLLAFCLFKLDVQAAEQTEFEELVVEYLPGLTLDGTIAENSASGQITTFNGFYLFFAPISYKGQKLGFQYQSSVETEYRYGFCEFPGLNGSPAYYQGKGTSGLGNLVGINSLVSPIDEGYMVVAIYQGDKVSSISFYSRETTQDSINNLGTTIVENQNQNTEDIINNNNENTDKIIESQEQINDSLTSTDYDENTISVDTSSLDDLQENEDILNYPMQLVQKLTDIVNDSNWDTVEVIDIGVPYTDKKIQLRSDMLYNFIKDTAFENLLSVFWIYVFGRYMIHFGLRIYHWLRTGEAVRKSFNVDGEAITAALM